MQNSAVRFWLTLLVVAVGLYGSFSLWRAYRTTAQAESTADVRDNVSAKPRALSEFTFTERNGLQVNLQSLSGKVWIASFFFSGCPGYCKQMNAVLAELQAEMSALGVVFVSISVDPVIDTPKVLSDYANTFKADPNQWLFLTGSLSDAQDLGESVFHVTVRGKDHSDRLILVDQNGIPVGQFHSREPMQIAALKRTVHSLLDAK